MATIHSVDHRYFYHGIEFTDSVYRVDPDPRISQSSRRAIGRPAFQTVIREVQDGYRLDIASDIASAFTVRTGILVIWNTETNDVRAKLATVADTRRVDTKNRVNRLAVTLRLDETNGYGGPYVLNYPVDNHYYRIVVYSTEVKTLTLGNTGSQTTMPVVAGMNVSGILDVDEYAVNIAGITSNMNVFITSEGLQS